MKLIHKILIANRGEIAVRVIRTARRMGIKTVAVYSEVDADSLHVTAADEAWCLGEVELSDTYLNIEKIVEVAKNTGCDAIHPGYGFLAENPRFVAACNAAKIIFIGPGTHPMQVMGNKIEARAFVKKINIPMTEGVTGTPEVLEKTAHTIGFPVLLKAAAGGGGKGMRIVGKAEELAEAIESTARQAKAYFGDATVYIEKYIEEPRHIEVQILGDHFGNVIHLFERECSIQRRYQKIIEESPSPTLTPEVRQQMGEAAVAIGREIGYNNAGTIEFLVDKQLNFYFLEMNTRIQVEHPVTEMVTGIDIVEEQIHIAAGNPLRLTQEMIRQQGHAIECRIYAEDPSNNFQPSPGKMTYYQEPVMAGIRIDTGITADTEIKSSFDPMISKLVVWGKDRNEASHLMLEALSNYVIHGIKTNITYLTKLIRGEHFIANTITTRFCDEHTDALAAEISAEKSTIPLQVPVAAYLIATMTHRRDESPKNDLNIWERLGYWRDLMNIRMQCDGEELMVEILRYTGKVYHFKLSGDDFQAVPVHFTKNRLDFTLDHHNHTAYISEDPDRKGIVSINGHTFQMSRHDILADSVTPSLHDSGEHDSNHITSPMPGKVIRIMVKAGDEVKKGTPLMIIEAMKMENLIVARKEGTVKEINVALNDRVESSKVLMALESNSAPAEKQ
jgi:3-methylcrotonyl-CoA carboxylase alpha subunit